MTNFALLQTNIAFCDPEANFKRVRELFAQAMAKDPRPDVVVLPEDWSAGFSDEMFHHMEDFVEPENGPSVTVLRELAQAVAWSPSLSAAVENDYVQPIGQSQTVNGVTATVE